MFLAYEGLLYLVLILGLPFFLLRGKYLSNLSERAGSYRSPAQAHDLWLHAVSVGEAIAARPVMTAIERMRPNTSVVITTTTITGLAQAKRLYPNATITYFPLDFSFAVRRFLDHHQPRTFATMETEIWPNVIRIAKSRGVKMLLANGRLSDRSFPKYRLFAPLVRRVLRQYDRILAREDLDRERFVSIGAPREIVETSGNVKFDYEPDETPLAIAAQLTALIDNRSVFILGSTIEGEDERLIPELERLKNVFVIIAPRKPDRFEAVASLLSANAIPFERRSALGEAPPSNVLLVDTIGELARMYRYATAAFVGGSLVSSGGHNPIEPAAAGVPVCFGPSMSNFREIASKLLGDHAAEQVSSAAEAIAFAQRMITDASARNAMSERARRVVTQNRGASERTARRIVELLA
jgi:3-deoxy-D-manno-octulosonic-acid transferase